MPKRPLLFLLLTIFFYGPNFVSANLSINEIFYSPASKQWIEIYNDGDTSVDLTKYKILDSGASVNGHSLAPLTGGSDFIEPHNFIVVAKVPEDFGSVVFRLFKASLGIKTSGDTIVLRDTTGNASDNVVLLPNNLTTDGNSWQKIEGNWVSSLPTPGTTNQNSVIPSPLPTVTSATGNLISTGSENNISNSTKIKPTEEPRIKTQILAKTLGFTSFPLSFEARAFGLEGEAFYFGKYFWNFGDGDSKEINLKDSQPFSHTFFYPGEYTISLSYYQNYYSDIPDATTELTVKIISADVSISRVGDAKDFFVELSNNTDYKADISGWFLASENKNFIIPRNTILQPKKKIIISPQITGFSIADKNTLKLINPKGDTVFDYSTVGKILAPSGVQHPTGLVTQAYSDVGRPNRADIQVPAENLLASAPVADFLGQDTQEKNSSPVIPLVSVIFIGAGAGSVYYIRQKKVIPQIGNDFEILDE